MGKTYGKNDKEKPTGKTKRENIRGEIAKEKANATGF